MRNILLAAIGLAMASVSQASFTVATFADPSQTGDAFLFTWDRGNNTLSGAWTASGMVLETPGFNGGGSVANAHFSMDPVALSVIIPNVLYTMGKGTVNFYTTDPNNPFFTIGFNGGTFLNPGNAGASALGGNTVSFTGPDVPGNLTNQQFSFSFANSKTAEVGS